jgi:hypothetical protein
MDRCREMLEELGEGDRIVGIERCGAQRAEPACRSFAELRPTGMTLAPWARARRAVSSPMPVLPPITTTVCPGKSGSRAVKR